MPKRVSAQKPRTRSRIRVSRHNLGHYDVFWSHLLWDYLDDLRDLLTVRKLMTTTRHVKGNVAHQTHIGKFTFAQFLQVNAVPNPDLIVFADDRSLSYFHAVQDFLRILDIRPLGVFIPKTVVFYHTIAKTDAMLNINANIECTHISSGKIMSTWRKQPADTLKIVVDVDSNAIYQFNVNHPKVHLICRQEDINDMHFIEVSIIHKNNDTMHVAITSPFSNVLVKQTNAVNMIISDFTQSKYTFLTILQLKQLILWVEEHSYESTKKFQYDYRQKLPGCNVLFNLDVRWYDHD